MILEAEAEVVVDEAATAFPTLLGCNGGGNAGALVEDVVGQERELTFVFDALPGYLAIHQKFVAVEFVGNVALASLEMRSKMESPVLQLQRDIETGIVVPETGIGVFALIVAAAIVGRA